MISTFFSKFTQLGWAKYGWVEFTDGNDSRCGTHAARSRHGTPVMSLCM